MTCLTRMSVTQLALPPKCLWRSCCRIRDIRRREYNNIYIYCRSWIMVACGHTHTRSHAVTLTWSQAVTLTWSHGEILCYLLTYLHAVTLTHGHMRSHTHGHMQSHSHAVTCRHTHTRSHAVTLTHGHMRSHSHTVTCRHTHTRSPAVTLTHVHMRSHSHTVTCVHLHIRSHPCGHTHTVTCLGALMVACTNWHAYIWSRAYYHFGHTGPHLRSRHNSRTDAHSHAYCPIHNTVDHAHGQTCTPGPRVTRTLVTQAHMNSIDHTSTRDRSIGHTHIQ